jgi:Tfp pilus assembly protein PilV
MRHITKPQNGLTIAELLLAMGVLSVIVTFNVSKLLTASTKINTQSRYNEVRSTLTGAYQNFLKDARPSASTKPSDILPYMNYASLDISSTLQDGAYSYTCNSGTSRCINFQTGGTLMFWDTETLGGIGPLNFLWFGYDPDAEGPLNMVWIVLYANGRITTWGNLLSGSATSNGVWAAAPSRDPDWLN